MILAKDFVIQEFVPRGVFERFGERSIWFVDPGLIRFCQWIRDYTQAPVTINNWHRAGHYKESGLRDPMTSTGARYSQHKFGKAADIKVSGYTSDAIREIIRDNFKILNERFGISTIEKDTPTWTHVDTRYTGLDHLYEVSLK